MASIFSWFKSIRKYMGIVKQEVNKYGLLKISDVIAKVWQFGVKLIKKWLSIVLEICQ